MKNLRISLVAYRDYRGLTLRQMAKLLDLDYTVLSKFEGGGDMDAFNLARVVCWLFDK